MFLVFSSTYGHENSFGGFQDVERALETSKGGPDPVRLCFIFACYFNFVALH
jgi:hypothetical protein